jgi:hypothetical protein
LFSKFIYMQNLPAYISVVFILTTIASVIIFLKAAGNNKALLYLLLTWLLLQGIIAYSGFYTSSKEMPPRFILAIVPPLVAIILLIVTPKGQRWVDQLNLHTLTLLHIVRVPVEIVLFWLFVNKAVPEVMTFEGYNFDILSGLTAPIVWYFTRNSSNKSLLLFWNFICLALLINIVTTAILAAPFAFQRIAFDQPNIAVAYFPFIWLPACIVPLVLLSHLVAIRQIIIRKTDFKPQRYGL